MRKAEPKAALTTRKTERYHEVPSDCPVGGAAVDRVKMPLILPNVVAKQELPGGDVDEPKTKDGRKEGRVALKNRLF